MIIVKSEKLRNIFQIHTTFLGKQSMLKETKKNAYTRLYDTASVRVIRAVELDAECRPHKKIKTFLSFIRSIYFIFSLFRKRFKFFRLIQIVSVRNVSWAFRNQYSDYSATNKDIKNYPRIYYERWISALSQVYCISNHASIKCSYRKALAVPMIVSYSLKSFLMHNITILSLARIYNSDLSRCTYSSDFS